MPDMDREKYGDQIKTHRRGGVVHQINEAYTTRSNIDCIKFVLEVQEGSAKYYLEFYAYGKKNVGSIEYFNHGDHVVVEYFTNSKLNGKTGLFYTTNTAVNAEITNQKEIDILNSMI